MNSNQQSKNSPRIQLYPSPNLNKCIECQQPTVELYQTHPRLIRQFGGFQEIVEHVFICQTPSCSRVGLKLYPDRLTPPNSAYHFEVIYEVGRLRKHYHQTYQEIISILHDRHVPIGMSSSCAHHLFQYYEIYEQSWNDRDLSEQCQGQDVVLAIDGAKPENGAPTLYLVTNAETKEVYGSNWLLYNGTKELTELLHRINQLDLNVVGFVSDKQRSLLLGVQEVFGDIPHQYCQYHWFQAAFHLLCDQDRTLNKLLRKGVRKLRIMTRAMKDLVTAGKLPPVNLQFLQELEPFITVLLQAKNKPPFVLKGRQAWNRLKAITTRILTLLEDLQISVFKDPTHKIIKAYKSLVMSVRVITKILEETVFTAWEITQASSWLLSLENYLNPQLMPPEWNLESGCHQFAKTRITNFLANLECSGSPFLSELRFNIVQTFHKWRKGILMCFEDPRIPRTNNHLEQFVYQLKRKQIKISGRRNNHLTLRYRQCFRYGVSLPPKPKFLAHCAQLGNIRYRFYRQKRIKMLEPLRKEYRIKRNFSHLLDLSFEQIRQEVNLSSVCT